MTPTPLIILVGAHLREGRSLALEEARRLKDAGEEGPLAVIVEGGPGTLIAPPGIELVQLAAGCVCCLGQLPLRVSVARLIRQAAPARMWIEVGSAEHLPALRRQLNGPGFAGAVRLEDGGDSV